jgi:hypothetical protein
VRIHDEYVVQVRVIDCLLLGVIHPKPL